MVTRSGNVDNIALGPWQCDAPGAATCQCKCQSGRVCLPHINFVTLFVRGKKRWYFRTAHFCENQNREWYVCCGARSAVCSASSNLTMFADQVMLFSEGGVYQLLVAKHLFLSKYLFILDDAGWAFLSMLRLWAVWEAWLVMPQPGSPHALATHKLVSFVFANISQTHNLRSP